MMIIRITPVASSTWEVGARSLTAEEWQEQSARTRRFFWIELEEDEVTVRKDGLCFLSESLILAQDKRWRRA
jgi:hypothetical protein